MDTTMDGEYAVVTRFLNWILFGTLAILNYFDYVFTKSLMMYQGYEVEANPLMYHAVVYFDSPDAILWCKTGALAILGVCIFIFRGHHRLTDVRVYRILGILNLILAGIVLWGYYLNTVQFEFIRINNMLGMI